MGTYLLHFLKQHLTSFVDLVYWNGLEKKTLHFDFFGSINVPPMLGAPPSVA